MKSEKQETREGVENRLEGIAWQTDLTAGVFQTKVHPQREVSLRRNSCQKAGGLALECLLFQKSGRLNDIASLDKGNAKDVRKLCGEEAGEDLVRRLAMQSLS